MPHVQDPSILALQAPPCRISSEYGEALDDEDLRDIAEFFAYIDSLLLDRISQTIRTVLGSNIDAPELLRAEVKISNIQRQLNDVSEGRRRFSTEYLRDKFLISFFTAVYHNVDQALKKHPEHVRYLAPEKWSEEILSAVKRRIQIVPKLLATAVARNVLGNREREAIRLRWKELDELLERHSFVDQTPAWPPWSEVRMFMDATRTNNTTTAPNAKLTSPHHSTTVIYWTTATFALFISIPCIIQAYRFSPHKPGSSQDADFWLLLQTGGMQTLNLATAGYAIFKDRTLSRFSRNTLLLATAVGMSFIAAALVLYTTVPTEWSGVVNCFAGFVQALIVVQVLFEKKDKID